MACLLTQWSYAVAAAAEYGYGLIQVPRNTFPRNTEQLSKFSVEQYTAYCLVLIAIFMIDAEQNLLDAFL